MIIDAHLHLCPEGVGSLPGVERKSLKYGQVQVKDRTAQVFPPSFERSTFSAEMALAFMDWCGIDAAFLLQGTMYGDQNGHVAAAIKQWPDRFLGTAMMDPSEEGAQSRLERMVQEHGIGGLKMEVPAQKSLNPKLSMTGDREMKVWEKCQELGLLLTMHLASGVEAAEEVAVIADAFPELILIVCHIGLAPHEGWKEQVRLAKRENVYAEISGIPALYAKEEYPYPGGQEAIRWAVREIGAKKMMWGTDAPSILTFCSFPQTLNLVKTRCEFLSDEDRERILGGTAKELWDSVMNNE